MNQKVSKTTKIVISLVMVICLLFVSLMGLTFAYNSDDKSFSGVVNFGTVKLNVTATVSGSSVTMTDNGALELDKSWNSNSVSWTGTIPASSSSTITFKISPKSGTEPAYYLAMLSSSNNAFTNCLYFSDGTNYYINNGNKTYLQSDSSKTAVTGKYVGTLAKNATHSFSVTLTNSLTETGSVTLTVYAMQMANVDAYNTTDTTKSAYNQLTKYTESYVHSTYTRDGNYIYFGSYPQTYAGTSASDLGITSTTEDENGYLTATDGTKYKKITANPNKYDGPYYYSDDTEVVEAEAYFKVEPLKWRVVEEENGVAKIVSEKAIQCLAYQPTYSSVDGVYYATDGNGNILTDGSAKVYANNYKYSNLRNYLTGEFYTIAFSAIEKEIINKTTVDNGATENNTSVTYACANTYDYIFALSYQEMNADNKVWGVALKTLTYENTDYTLANNVYNGGTGTYAGCGWSWLRSPYSDNSSNVWFVSGGGIYSDGMASPSFGVVPGLRICL